MKKRILHTMLRVADLNRSIQFYTELLGMVLLRMHDNPEFHYTLAFLGFGAEETSAVLELTYNYGISEYDQGAAYGHIAIGVEDCYGLCEIIQARGGKVVRPPGPLKGGNEIIAFVEDPDGYRIEIIERPYNWF